MKLPQVGDSIFERLEHDTSDYLVDGERVVSVTEALRIAGLVDYSGVSQEALLKGAERGTMVHAITAHLDGGCGANFTPGEALDTEPFVTAYMQFKQDTGFEPELIEHLVVSQKWRYAGRLDRTGLMGRTASSRQHVLLDLKTGNSMPAWVGLQLKAYEIVLGEGGYGSTHRYALRLQDNGRYFLHRYNDASDRADWLAALRISQWQLRHGGWSLD